MSAWSGWSACDKTCGGGSQSRYRNILTPAAFGGLACEGTLERVACNPNACPPKIQFGYQGSQQAIYDTVKVLWWTEQRIKRVDNMRTCRDYGTHLGCSNVLVSGRGLQTVLGCPTATDQLRRTCQDTWTVSLQDCCWCDENGNRCLLRASKPDAYVVPKGVSVVDEPHFIDWLGRSWDYQGVDDHVLVEVPGFRVDIKLAKCSAQAQDVTCITEAAFVDTVTKQSVQFKVGVETPFNCDGPITAVDGKFKAAGILATADEKGNALAKFTVTLGGKLFATVVVDKEILDVVVSVAKDFKDGELLGGLLSGVPASQVRNVWGPGLSKLRKDLEAAKVIRVGAGKALEAAVTWRLKPEKSYICSTKSNPYKFNVKIEVSKNRIKNNVTNEIRFKYNECCYMLQCSPQSYDECVFDHHLVNGVDAPKKCIAGYNTLAPELCQRRESGDCKGGWTTWSKCTEGVASRRYIIEKLPLPGFDNCAHEHDHAQISAC